MVTSALGFTPYSNSNPSGFTSFSGAYADLSGKPTIPTNNNQLTNGEGYYSSGDTVSFGVVTGTELRSTGDIIAYFNSSDLALKENITPIDNALDKVMSLDGINWTYKNDGRAMTGLIAQQVQKVLPEAVFETDLMDSNGHLAIRYGNVVGLLVESIKELSEKVKELGGE